MRRRIEGLPLRLPTLRRDVGVCAGGGGAKRRDGPVSYWIELGGIGTGAQADNVPGQPIFANGFLIGAGLRVYP